MVRCTVNTYWISDIVMLTQIACVVCIRTPPELVSYESKQGQVSGK